MRAAILAVEDSLTQRERLGAELAAAGFDVVLAADGEEALGLLGDGRFDLVLTDVVMPRVDGYELCRRVKAVAPDLPVVVLTSLTDPTEIFRGLEAGADNFLRKPYQVDQLVGRLREVLEAQRRREAGEPTAVPEVVVGGQRFAVTAERQQMLDLLVSSFGELVEVNEQLDATELERRRLDALLWAVPQAIVITDAQGVVTEVSDRFLAILGRGREEVVGRRSVDCARLWGVNGEPIPDGERPIWQVLSGRSEFVEVGTSFDVAVETPAGPMPVIIRAAPVRDRSGAISAAVAVVEGIGALSNHDLLTRLPNHAIFVDRVVRAARQSAAEGLSYGVVAVALDRFERLRASLSPAAVDDIVRDLAARLRNLVDVGNGAWGLASASYFADDMFGVILPDLDDETAGVRFAKELAAELSVRHHVEGVTVDLSATAAVVFDDGSSDDPVRLVTAAIRAAREASSSGPGGTVEVVDPSVGQRASELLRREAELRDAIDQGQLEVHYQPIVGIQDGRPLGFEALVRWRHPERGLVPPNEFIPLAEDSGLVIPLGWWVLERACRDCARWRRELPGAAEVFVSVNLAASQLNLAEVADRVTGVLDEVGLDPSGLRLEVTETGVVADADTAAVRLAELTDRGVRVIIDDFGTGYASLLQLRRFPVSGIKIDRTFVSAMIEEPDDAAIVAASLSLALAMGLGVVAEGVETRQQHEALRHMGCPAGQGFLWSRPLSATDLVTWWTAQAADMSAKGAGQTLTTSAPAGQTLPQAGADPLGTAWSSCRQR